MSASTVADLGQVRSWLDFLMQSPGLLAICSTGDWAGRAFDNVDEAVEYVAQLDALGREGIYHRVTTLTERPAKGRGGAELSHVFFGLWADLDIAGPGHKATPEPLPADEAAARKIVAAAGLPDPNRWVHSGGGLYPWWFLSEPHVIGEDRQRIEQLSVQWQRALGRGAASLGLHYGEGVGDLARVLRVPGTINRKEGLSRPCVLLREDGPRYDLDGLYEAAQSVAPAPSAPAHPTIPDPSIWNDWDKLSPRRDGPGPFDALAEAARWSDLLQPLGWEHVGTERDGAELWKRPGGTSEYSARCGHNGVPVMVVHSTDAGLPAGPGQHLTMGRVFAHLHYGGNESDAATDIRLAAAGDPTSGPARHLPYHVLTTVAKRCEVTPWSPPPSIQQPPTALNGAEVAEPPKRRTWRPVDLTDVLEGRYDPPKPTVGMRDDGVGLFYAGRVHSIASESEGGKTWLALAAGAAELAAGNSVLYLDFEDDEGGVVGRLLALGADRTAIRERFAYIRPEDAITALGNQIDLFEVLGDLHPTLAVLDGVTEAMTLHGLELKDNTDIARFGKMLPRWLADLGPAVVALDHLVKDKEGQGRYAIGGVHKLNGINGAAFLLRNREPFGIGLTGRSGVYVAKDRPGQLRRHAVASSGGLHWLADLVLTSHNEDFVEVGLPSPIEQASGPFRPTKLMAKVCDVLVANPEGLSKTAVETMTSGKTVVVRAALELLVNEGYVAQKKSGQTLKHTLVRPYVEGL